MKELDLIKLKNAQPYLKYNLQKNAHGIVVKNENETLKVMFFNPQNVGDYIIADIRKCDTEKEFLQLPQKIKNELSTKLENALKKPKTEFYEPKIKLDDFVELIVENEKYTKMGLHKGDKGCVVSEYAFNGNVLVDFYTLDESSEYFCDCIEIDCKDLKVIEEKESN